MYTTARPSRARRMVAASCLNRPSAVCDRLRLGVVRVHLDDPAEAVDLVGLPGHVEAGVEPLPLALGRLLADAVTLRPPGDGRVADGGRIGEVLVEVLLSGQERAPRRDAARAVVERAQHAGAG